MFIFATKNDDYELLTKALPSQGSIEQILFISVTDFQMQVWDVASWDIPTPMPRLIILPLAHLGRFFEITGIGVGNQQGSLEGLFVHAGNRTRNREVIAKHIEETEGFQSSGISIDDVRRIIAPISLNEEDLLPRSIKYFYALILSTEFGVDPEEFKNKANCKLNLANLRKDYKRIINNALKSEFILFCIQVQRLFFGLYDVNTYQKLVNSIAEDFNLFQGSLSENSETFSSLGPFIDAIPVINPEEKEDNVRRGINFGKAAEQVFNDSFAPSEHDKAGSTEPIDAELYNVLETIGVCPNSENIKIGYDGSHGYELSENFCLWYSENYEECERTSRVPLFFTPCVDVRSKKGLSLPSEFVFSIFYLSKLQSRVCQLGLMHDSGLSGLELREFSVGAARRHFELDQEDHGHTAPDLRNLFIAQSTDSGMDKLRNKFLQVGEHLGRVLSDGDNSLKDTTYKMLIGKELPEIKKRWDAINNELITTSNTPTSYVRRETLIDKYEATLPRRLGLDLRFHIPTAKASVLLVDDNADGAKQHLEELFLSPLPESESSPSISYRELFQITPLKISFGGIEAKRKSVAKDISEGLKYDADQIWGRTRFDLILLDLLLGEPRNEEPAGYRVLPVLRRFFPNIPIIVYSQFDDIGHIEKAFSKGATWYLPKRKAWKLPQVFVRCLEQPNWEREWNAEGSGVKISGDVGDKDKLTRYLIWKAAEGLPGSRLEIRSLRGGIGGAQTFRVEKTSFGQTSAIAPIVVKVDHRFPMLMERERFRRFIHPFVSNLAGRVEQDASEGGDGRASIAYSYAGISQGSSEGGFQDIQVVPLESLLQLNLPKCSDYVLGPEKYDGLLHALLERILPRIHHVDINPEKDPIDHIDYPNILFEEFGDPRDSYLSRLPPEAEIPLEVSVRSISEAKKEDLEYARNLESITDIEAGKSVLVTVLEVERGKDLIKAIIELVDGRIHRVNLTGVLAGFYPNHRHLRPMQPLIVQTLKGYHCARESENSAWTELWHEPDGRSLFGGDGEEDHPYQFDEVNMWTGCNNEDVLADSVVRLRKWLVTDQVSEPLRQGKVGIIHGDLNLGNVMVERLRRGGPLPYMSTPWLIDFARSRRDRIVIDYTQLEVDLLLRLTDASFFAASVESQNPSWQHVEDTFRCFLESRWNIPSQALASRRLGFVYALMARVFDAAELNSVETLEYQTSRVFQLLIAHKIMCGRWKKRPGDQQLRFASVLALKLAFENARLLGWDPAKEW